MTRTPGLMVLAATALMCAVPALSAPPKAKSGGSPLPKFPFASGRVTYKFDAGMAKGTQTLSWIEHGKRSRQDISMKLPTGAGGAATGPGGKPMPASIETWAITDEKYVYTQNSMMGPNVQRMEIKKLAGGRAPMAGGPAIAAPADLGKPVGKATIAGKPCEIFQKGKAKWWVWQKLPLKIEASSERGAVSFEATKVEAPASVDAARFKVPAGAKIVDVDPHAMMGGGAGRPRMGTPPTN